VTEELESQVELEPLIQICLMRQVSGGICNAVVAGALSMKDFQLDGTAGKAWDTLR
jgi:hypothetical protein